MITTNRDDLAERIRLLRSHGMTSMAYERQQKHLSGYDVVVFGFNYRTDEMHSALGRAQLRKIDEINRKRRQVFRWYLEELEGNGNVVIPFRSANLEMSTCHIMVVMLKEHYEAIRTRLTEAGVQTSKHYTPIPQFSVYGSKEFRSKVTLIRNLLTLPMSSFLSRKDVSYICSVINSAV
jgi:dTDP-4-amino-4,6-dideoxygalactose transaminase